MNARDGQAIARARQLQCGETTYPYPKEIDLIDGLSALGHKRKSAAAARMSGVGGKAEVDFGRLEVCS